MVLISPANVELPKSRLADDADNVELVDGIEDLLDAYANDVIDLPPALQSMLFDVLEAASTGSAAHGARRGLIERLRR